LRKGLRKKIPALETTNVQGTKTPADLEEVLRQSILSE